MTTLFDDALGHTLIDLGDHDMTLWVTVFEVIANNLHIKSGGLITMD
jgi:hypothetical protein